ncbi:glycoside hydrolase [Chlamydiales bacterium]|nr:glycoside hydrolase [Chlamydiales bacterium]
MLLLKIMSQYPKCILNLTRSFLKYFPSDIEIIKTGICHEDPKHFSGWSTITSDENQTLYLAYSGDRLEHVDPYGKNFLLTSTDQGGQWSNPHLIDNSPLDNRDAGLIFTPKGTLILSYFTSIYFAEDKRWKKPEKEILDEQLGSFIRRSLDQGKTFEKPIKIPISSPHGPIVGIDNNLYYVGNEKRDISFYTSKDEGITWEKLSTLFPARYKKKFWLCEPHVISLNPHTFLCFLRSNTKRSRNRYLFQSLSTDSGKTWTAPQRTNLWGLPPHLMRHSSGLLICSYGYRKWPFSVRASWSSDNGVTWRGDTILSSSYDNDLGYPSTIELKDGSLYTVYYQISDNSKLPSIFFTHWRIANS